MSTDHKRGGQEHTTTKRQEQGYDEAARGGPGAAPSDVGIPPNPGEEVGGDEFDRAARQAANDVRQRERQ
ncbi:MAG: hypothetical protein JSU08_15000 [Acidobacteria bacterium]|nr:hypothetical protein [Acidobacteriota bacterium]